MSMDAVLALVDRERKNCLEEMDRRLKQVEVRAANDLDAVLKAQVEAQDQGQTGENAAGESQPAFGHSTPGPSGNRRVFFSATPATPIVRIDADDDDDDKLDVDEEPEVSLQEQATAAAQAVLSAGATAANKRDKQPPPLSFWTGRAAEPVGMGQIGGSVSNFIGKRTKNLQLASHINRLCMCIIAKMA
jgi:hypothetical protein